MLLVSVKDTWHSTLRPPFWDCSLVFGAFGHTILVTWMACPQNGTGVLLMKALPYSPNLATAIITDTPRCGKQDTCLSFSPWCSPSTIFGINAEETCVPPYVVFLMKWRKNTIRWHKQCFVIVESEPYKITTHKEGWELCPRNCYQVRIQLGVSLLFQSGPTDACG